MKRSYLKTGIIQMLISYGADIHAKDANGVTPLSLVTHPALKAEVIFIPRRSLVLFFEAMSVADDLKNQDSLFRVAGNAFLARYIVGFL